MIGIKWGFPCPLKWGLPSRIKCHRVGFSRTLFEKSWKHKTVCDFGTTNCILVSRRRWVLIIYPCPSSSPVLHPLLFTSTSWTHLWVIITPLGHQHSPLCYQRSTLHHQHSPLLCQHTPLHRALERGVHKVQNRACAPGGPRLKQIVYIHTIHGGCGSAWSS